MGAFYNKICKRQDLGNQLIRGLTVTGDLHCYMTTAQERCSALRPVLNKPNMNVNVHE